MSGFCRIYALLLYAYPRDFRRAYGRDMQQVFRDRCREVARAGWRPILQFAAHVTQDLLTSTVRERAASAWVAARKSPRRGFISEWAVTILMYLFAATTLVQAYVVPTGSMESTIRVGDHMLVDRVGYANPGTLGRHILPYRDIQRGDVVGGHHGFDRLQAALAGRPIPFDMNAFVALQHRYADQSSTDERDRSDTSER